MNNARLGEEGTEQFTIKTRVNGELIQTQPIHDPFIFSTTTLKGWKHAWSAIFGSGIRVEINLSGSLGVERAIMNLDPLLIEKETQNILSDLKASRESNGVMGFYAETIG